MEYFYGGQIRNYLNQLVRMFSGFKYQTADGKQYTVPVVYGDLSRQVSHIIKENSENKLPSVPRMAVYISQLKLDRSNLRDPSNISSISIRERRQILDDAGNVVGYGTDQGHAYTVERLMPTPYKLVIKLDIWASSSDQKNQIMEQLMMLFNPSLELQTSDNFIDWSSLTVVELTDISYDNRNIPLGVDADLNVGTMTFDVPIFINPPSKVKRMGLIQSVIMNIHDNSYSFETDVRVSISNFSILVHAIPNSNSYQVEFLDPTSIAIALSKDNPEAFKKIGMDVTWRSIVDLYPGKFKAGYSQLFLTQQNTNVIVGTVALNQSDDAKLIVNLDPDSYPTNKPIITNSAGLNPRATIDAIINPLTFNPRPVLTNLPVSGTRYLILDNINGEWLDYVTELNPLFDQDLHDSDPNYNVPRLIYVRDVHGNRITYSTHNMDGSDAWAEWDLTNINNPVKVADFVAKANDIIEWNGVRWEVVLEVATIDQVVYTTNLKTGVQYKYENNEWVRSFEGSYTEGWWRLVL